MSRDSKNLVELIELIEKRPAMYISTNSISALKAFISGWLFADPNIDASILNKFTHWLNKTNNTNNDFIWDKVILLYSNDEYQALDNFFKLFNEFKTSEKIS